MVASCRGFRGAFSVGAQAPGGRRGARRAAGQGAVDHRRVLEGYSFALCRCAEARDRRVPLQCCVPRVLLRAPCHAVFHVLYCVLHVVAGLGADKFHNGWLVTGDVASIDPEYYMTIRDRSKDLIKSGRVLTQSR